MKLRIHALIPHTEVNGPGRRFCVWAQGCSKKCPDCYNPEAQDIAGGYDLSIEELYDRIVKTPEIEGVSFSGGEPLEQAEALTELIKRLKKHTKLSILIFTAFTMEQLQKYPHVLQYTDHIVWNHRNEKADIGYRESPSVCFSDQLPQDLELHILENGDVQITGFPNEYEKEIMKCFVSE